MNGSVAERFWAKVDKRGPDECWPWTAGKHQGYGRIRISGKTMQATRVSWEFENGPIPPGLDVLHRCDNPPCVNPAHLFLGTQADNQADMVAKGRARGGSRPGTRNPSAKLTAEQAAEIRSASGTHAALAARFGVSRATVYYIKAGLHWRF